MNEHILNFDFEPAKCQCGNAWPCPEASWFRWSNVPIFGSPHPRRAEDWRRAMKDNRKLWVVEVFLRTAWQPFRYFETRAEARTELTEQRRIRLVRVVQYIPKRRKVK